MEIDFAVLGPWQVKSTDGELTVPVGHLRTLLALILLAGGEPVPIATLAEHLWGDRQPAKARSALTTYVARLRQVLGPDTILTCLGIGYRLGVPAARVDLHRFRELVQDSRQTASAEGELSMLLEALNLWRGQPFTGIDSPWLDHDVVPALAEEWLTATERRIDLELARGPSSALITELRKLTQTYPLRESLWCRLILVLHAAGRRADALTTYQQIRAALSEEIGLDPCEELQRAHLFVLRDNGSAETTAAGELPTGPHQLPYDNAKFSGRDRELAALDELLTDGQSASHPTTTIVAIDGAPGTGKTTLAVHWAYRVKDRYPDVQVYLNLRGYSSRPGSAGGGVGNRAPGARGGHRKDPGRPRRALGPAAQQPRRPPGASAAGQRPRRGPGPATDPQCRQPGSGHQPQPVARAVDPGRRTPGHAGAPWHAGGGRPVGHHRRAGAGGRRAGGGRGADPAM